MVNQTMKLRKVFMSFFRLNGRDFTMDSTIKLIQIQALKYNVPFDFLSDSSLVKSKQYSHHMLKKFPIEWKHLNTFINICSNKP